MLCLYVSDHPDSALLRTLSELGHQVLSVRPDEATWAIAEEHCCAAIIFEHGGTDIGRLGACATSKPPNCILLAILTRQDSALRVAVLRAGADVCLTSPVSYLELEAILAALERRRRWSRVDTSADPAEPASTSGAMSLVLHRSSCRATVEGQPMALSLREFRLLIALAEAEGRTVHRELLLGSILDGQFETRSKSLDVLVNRLRRKLCNAGVVLETERNVGYRLLGRSRVE